MQTRIRSLCAVAVGLFLLLGGTASAASHYEGRAEGNLGAQHDFVVGDGFYLSFKDRRSDGTAYHVCWHRNGHHSHSCRNGRTGGRGHWDKIAVGAPSKVGNYTVKWFVSKHSVARWSLHIGIGD